MSKELEKRLQRLENEKAIIETMTLYGHYIDYGFKEEFANLFTDDAQYHALYRGKTMPSIGIPQENGVGIVGRAKILEYVKTHTQPPELWHKHCAWNPVITFQSDTVASSVVYMARFDEDVDGPWMMLFGRYVDEFEKCSDGKWRFKKRSCEVESRYDFKRMGKMQQAREKYKADLAKLQQQG